jgi:hypothetical protein
MPRGIYSGRYPGLGERSETESSLYRVEITHLTAIFDEGM